MKTLTLALMLMNTALLLALLRRQAAPAPALTYDALLSQEEADDVFAGSGETTETQDRLGVVDDDIAKPPPPKMTAARYKGKSKSIVAGG
jgi:hypothetical protein